MGFIGKVLREEHRIAGLHHTRIVVIHIVHEEPRADTVISQTASLLHQLHDVFVEQQTGLILRVLSQVMSAGIPQMTVLTMCHLMESAVQSTCLHACLQISPYSNLRSVERCLLDDRQGIVGIVAFHGKDSVSLVVCITQEIAFENGLGPRKILTQQLGVSLIDGCQLFAIG